MATREKRLAQFDGSGEPPQGQAIEVLCEDHSGTYQLPFPCVFFDGKWYNQKSGDTLEATVVGWRLPRIFCAEHVIPGSSQPAFSADRPS